MADSSDQPTGLSITLIEDNDSLRVATTSFLESKGFFVHAFESVEASWFFTSKSQIYIVDLNLPGVDGLEFIQQLRVADENVGIIVTTARTSDKDMTRGYTKGADIYLNKPVDPEALLAAIWSLGRRVAPTSTEFNGGHLDLIKQTIRGPEREIRLTPGEAKLLKALSVAPNRMIEYWEAAELLDMDFNAGMKSALEVRIVRLRKKLDAAGLSSPSIVSVRTVGYRLAFDLKMDNTK